MLLCVVTVASLPERGADDHDVAGDRRRRVQADLAGLEIDLLLVAVHDADLQIDDAVFAERRDRRAGLRVQLRRADSRS